MYYLSHTFIYATDIPTLIYCFLVVHKVNTRVNLSVLSRPKLLECQILVLGVLNYYIFPPLFRLIFITFNILITIKENKSNVVFM